jgi:G3E family GTPase
LKVAVIENEFGEVGIDDSLISKRQVEESKDEIVEMINGCVCCTVRKDLQEGLERLLITQKRPLDAILIETTGLADPAPVAQTFFVDEKLKNVCYLDAIITVVDSKHIEMQLSRDRPEGVENEAEEQLCFADRLILNKVDLVPDRSDLERIVNLMRSYNPMAEIIESTNSAVPMEKILGLKAFSLDRVLEKEPEFLEPDQEHMHDSNVTSVCVTSDKAVSVALLEGWIGALLQTVGADLFRYKGVLNVAGFDQRYVFQGVQMMFTGTFTSSWEPNEVRRSNFVFIGRNLPVDYIKESFHSCEAKPLRFQVGARVLANVGAFKPGVVLKQWDEGNAYRVRLDGDTEVWAPIDDDKYIKLNA